MKRYAVDLIIVILAAAACRLSFGRAAEPARQPSRRPNFVFFLADDMGWRDAGCYGSTFYETPNIDRLAKQGMRFTDAYAACPRVQPDAGEHHDRQVPGPAGHDRLLRRAAARLPSPSTGRGTSRSCPHRYLDHLPLEEVTIAEALKASGYRTFFTGKWHLGGRGYWPEDQGFDINIGGCGAGSPASYFSPYKNPKLPDGPKGEHLDDRMAAESVKFLEHVGRKPFLLYHAFYSVHIPLQAKRDLIAKYEAKRKRVKAEGPRFKPEGDRQARQVQDHAVYAAMIETMDRGVGQVLDALDRLGLADNTVVFFMSDNGGLSTAEGAPTSNLPLRAGKGWLYEGGIREPMIVKWPGVIKPGSTCSTPVISTDFYPTILEMAGLPARPATARGRREHGSVAQANRLGGRAGDLLALPALRQPGRQSGQRRPRRRLEADRVLRGPAAGVVRSEEGLGRATQPGSPRGEEGGRTAREAEGMAGGSRGTDTQSEPEPQSRRSGKRGHPLNGCRRLITVKEGQLAPATVRRARKREHGCN